MLWARGGLEAQAAPQPGTPAAHQAAAHEGAAAQGGHETESPWRLVARLINFAILAGTLVYFLRSPFAAFLTGRREQVRTSLQQAVDLRARAEADIASVEARMRTLDSEIEALRARGAEEVAAEEARIREAAEAERQRLAEQARRQIEHQARLARRALARHAADLAVTTAARRLEQTLGPSDHQQLLDRYLASIARHVPDAHGAPPGLATGERS